MTSTKDLRVTIDGVEHAARDVAHKNGISEATLRRRIRKGWDPLKACTHPQLVFRGDVFWDGREWSIVDLAKEYKISASTLRRRLDSGWSFERALTEPVQPKAEQPLKLEGGVYATLYYKRIGQGWDPQTAATKPPRFAGKTLRIPPSVVARIEAVRGTRSLRAWVMRVIENELKKTSD